MVTKKPTTNPAAKPAAKPTTKPAAKPITKPEPALYEAQHSHTAAMDLLPMPSMPQAPPVAPEVAAVIFDEHANSASIKSGTQCAIRYHPRDAELWRKIERIAELSQWPLSRAVMACAAVGAKRLMQRLENARLFEPVEDDRKE